MNDGDLIDQSEELQRLSELFQEMTRSILEEQEAEASAQSDTSIPLGT